MRALPRVLFLQFPPFFLLESTAFAPAGHPSALALATNQPDRRIGVDIIFSKPLNRFRFCPSPIIPNPL